jgi:hypothetical protein
VACVVPKMRATCSGALPPTSIPDMSSAYVYGANVRLLCAALSCERHVDLRSGSKDRLAMLPADIELCEGQRATRSCALWYARPLMQRVQMVSGRLGGVPLANRARHAHATLPFDVCSLVDRRVGGARQ